MIRRQRISWYYLPCILRRLCSSIMSNTQFPLFLHNSNLCSPCSCYAARSLNYQRGRAFDGEGFNGRRNSTSNIRFL
uniref:Uncharacterized protein n=1 Tax=Rhizophora mucronata TaxID=61149 RepID=A0A2P2NM68_RHIMU